MEENSKKIIIVAITIFVIVLLINNFSNLTGSAINVKWQDNMFEKLQEIIDKLDLLLQREPLIVEPQWKIVNEMIEVNDVVTGGGYTTNIVTGKNIVLLENIPHGEMNILSVKGLIRCDQWCWIYVNGIKAFSDGYGTKWVDFDITTFKDGLNILGYAGPSYNNNIELKELYLEMEIIPVC